MMHYKRTYRSLLPGCIALVITSSTVLAEEKGLEQLQDITVEATRVEKSLYEIPASVGAVEKDDIQYGRQQLGLDESLNKIPGIFMQNRYNFNQDLSVSIRGFGVADFGIRGVKIYVDGIPNTTPDGQGQIDNIDIGSIERMEVIRGPSSSLYGTASGGVINIYTEDGPVARPYVEGRAQFGSFGFEQEHIKAGGQQGKLNYIVSAQRLNYDGFRENSHIERYLFNSKFRWEIDSTSDFTVVANFLDKPIAQDPGGLTEDQLKEDRGQAVPNQTRFDAGETAEQQQFGLVYKKRFNENNETTLRNYHVFRNFNGKLPFPNAIAFDRYFTGGGIQHTYSDQIFGRNNRLTIGADVDSQMDERQRYFNNNGQVGALLVDQDEDVLSWGIFVQNEFSLREDLELSVGFRYDEVEFDFTDKFLSDGDDSGTVTFDEFSPAGGILYKYNDFVNLYGSISTSFETPSSTEFATPDDSGGFNQNLDSSTSTNYEVGVKGVLPGRTSYQLSIFHIDTKDELLIAGTSPGGSEFFENAGETTRDGIEAAVTFRPLQGLDVTLNYTYADLEFESFVDGTGNNFTGNKIPGTPEQFGYAEVAYYSPTGLYAVFDAQYVDQIQVNNDNTPGTETSQYVVANLRFGATKYYKDLEFTPFFGINNIFDRKYVGNVRVNGPGNRFYEPAPELNVFGGLTVKFQ